MFDEAGDLGDLVCVTLETSECRWSFWDFILAKCYRVHIYDVILADRARFGLSARPTMAIGNDCDSAQPRASSLDAQTC